MRVERGLLEDFHPGGPSVLTMGSFDGLHLGHQALIRRVVELAGREGLVGMMVSFEPHPRDVLKDGRPPVARLTMEEEKLQLLAECGLERVVLLRFTPELAAWEARRFIREGLLRRMALRHLVVGDNHAFGRNRDGDLETLKEASNQLGFGLEVLAPVLVDGDRVSSTRVRRALLEGSVEQAARLLGRPFALTGTVIRGQGRGHGLGVPTANLQVPDRQLLPRDGVYAVHAVLRDGRRLGGMMNLGPRPTFAEDDRLPEVHILGFAGDLYEQRLRVEFQTFVRDTMRFNSREQLMVQLQEDRNRIQDRLAGPDGTAG